LPKTPGGFAMVRLSNDCKVIEVVVGFDCAEPLLKCESPFQS
jgi:hypothetical protein